jgi:basic membrane protein A
MSKKLYPILAVLLIAAFALSACGGAASSGKLKVGLVTDTGGVNDKSFNQSACK